MDITNVKKREIWNMYAMAATQALMAKMMTGDSETGIRSSLAVRHADAMLAACLERFPLAEHETKFDTVVWGM